MKSLIGILILVAACSMPGVNYKVAEYEKYDVPAKSQISMRIVLNDSVTRANVSHVLMNEFKYSLDKSMTYHNPPSHIFIYVYDSSTNVKDQSDEWVGMISRVANENKGMVINL
jgi:hypothetical protein